MAERSTAMTSRVAGTQAPANIRKQRFVPTRAAMENSVEGTLGLDTGIPNPEQIAVSEDVSVVTACGMVGAFSQRRAA